jgi:ribosomal protein L11 methylase PrmA
MEAMITSSIEERLPSSFRDPSGHVFRRDGRLLRKVNRSYQGDYDLLMSSGLYSELVKRQLIVPHVELPVSADDAQAGVYKLIEPELIPFISYPYEWSFSMWKEAALTLLRIQKAAIAKGLTLKDASAYNFQLHKGRFCLIDTLSFERYERDKPWVAYKQFCQHFLAPLQLMAKVDIRLGGLSRNYIDGVPLDLATRLLPTRVKLKPAILVHIVLHSRAQAKYADAGRMKKTAKIGRFGLLGLIDSLEDAVQALSWKPDGTEWGDYYLATNYSDAAFENKKEQVDSFLSSLHRRFSLTIDLGGNTGVFSRVAAKHSDFTVSADIDPVAVEKNFLRVKCEKETAFLPLLIDLTNPSPAVGWANSERDAFIDRRRADVVLALALIHHLVISNNVPMERCGDFLARMGKYLVIEFVPKSDSQAQRLLASRADIFPDYHLDGFIKAFSRHFEILQRARVGDSERTLFLMRAR